MPSRSVSQIAVTTLAASLRGSVLTPPRHHQGGSRFLLLQKHRCGSRMRSQIFYSPSLVKFRDPSSRCRLVAAQRCASRLAATHKLLLQFSSSLGYPPCEVSVFDFSLTRTTIPFFTIRLARVLVVGNPRNKKMPHT